MVFVGRTLPGAVRGEETRKIKEDAQRSKIKEDAQSVPLWTKGYIINSETFSIFNPHVHVTFIINSKKCHACCSYMGRYPLTCWGMTRM